MCVSPTPSPLYTADRLAQFVERRTTARGAPDRTNTQGLKITEENVLPLYVHLQMVDILVFSDKEKKS